MSTKELQEQINTKSDAELKASIDARLAPIASMVDGLPAIEFEANDPAQSAQKITVSLQPERLVRLVARSIYQNRRDQARLQKTRDFLDKVAAAGIEI